MRGLFVLGTAIVCLTLAAGCRCSGLDNFSGDLIDTISEPRLTFDRWYRPELDLTRIGKPDWCRSRFNRLLCRDKCCGCGYASGCGAAETCGTACREAYVVPSGDAPPEVTGNGQPAEIAPPPPAPPAEQFQRNFGLPAPPP